MRSYFLSLLAVSLLGVSCMASAQTGQTPSGSSVPAKAKKGVKVADPKTPDPAAAKTEMPKHDYSQEGFVVEQYRSSYRFESDGTGRRETVARIRVQSEAGVQQWGQIQVGYNSANERVEISYVRVVKADGSIVKAGEDSVQDLTAPVEREAPVYTDYRQKHITVPGLRPGEVLEYDIVAVTHTALAPNQFWMEHDFTKNGIVLDEELEINIPQARGVKLKTRPGMEPKMRDENGGRIYQWTSSHRERDDDEKDDKKKKPKPEPEQP